LNSKNCDVSFSGLKTAALYSLRDKNLNSDEKAMFAAEFEDAVADVFVAKTRRALKETGACWVAYLSSAVKQAGCGSKGFKSVLLGNKNLGA